MIIPRANPVVQNRRTTDGQMTSIGTQNSVNMANTAANFLTEWKAQKDNTAVQEAMNASLKKKNEWKLANMAREGKAAEGLTEDYLKFNQDLKDEIGSNLSANAREKFDMWQDRDTEQDKLGVMVHQRKQDIFVKQSAFDEGISLAQEGLRQDAKNNWAKSYQIGLETLDNGLKSGVIRPEEFETKKLDMQNKFREEASKNYYVQDKHDFMRNGIRELGLGETEIAYYKDKYERDLRADEREKQSLFSEEKKIIMAQRDDMQAQAVANKDTSHFKEGAVKLQAMGYKAEAAELLEQAGQYDKVIAFQDEHRNMPLIEEGRAASALNVTPELEGSSSDYKANLAIQKEFSRKLKQFSSDPAAYVDSFVVGSNDEQRASSRLSLQQSQGIIPKDGFKVLTKAESDAAKAMWETGDMAQRKGIIMETFKYGKHAPKVISEMGINKALSLIPMLDNEQDIELFVAGVSDKKEVLLDDSKKSDYQNANKDSNFYQLQVEIQSMFPTNENLPQKVADLDRAMTGISARKVDPKAGGEFFDRNFKILNEGDKKVYYPKTADEDTVEQLLDQRKEELSNLKAKTAVARMAIRDAVWINTPNGFVLADPKKGLPVTGSEVGLLEVDELRKEMANKAKQDSMNIYSEKHAYNRR